MADIRLITNSAGAGPPAGAARAGEGVGPAVAGDGDRICTEEAWRLLAPPLPSEPPSWLLPTDELLSGLPGRPDRVATAAGRLASELGDVRSFNYYRLVAELVCSRQQPVEGLVSAWRQAIGSKAVRPGAVFATAWKREIRVTSP